MLVLEWKERVFLEKVNSRCFCCSFRRAFAGFQQSINLIWFILISILSINRLKSMTHALRLTIYLDFYRFHRFISEDTSPSKNLCGIKDANSKFIDNWGAIESRRDIYQYIVYQTIITFKEIFKKIFHVFFWWLILARFVGAQFFRT